MHGTTVLPRKTPTPQKNGIPSRVKFDDGLAVSDGRKTERRREGIQQLIEKLRAKEQREKKHTKSTDSQWKETPGKTPVWLYFILSIPFFPFRIVVRDQLRLHRREVERRLIWLRRQSIPRIHSIHRKRPLKERLLPHRKILFNQRNPLERRRRSCHVSFIRINLLFIETFVCIVALVEQSTLVYHFQDKTFRKIR